jgi:resuscitation-promoting factor RpfB
MYGPPPFAGHPPVPGNGFFGAAKRWWHRVPGVGKAGLVAAAVVLLCCGGMTVVGAIVGPSTPKPPAALSGIPTSSAARTESDTSPPPVVPSAVAPTVPAELSPTPAAGPASPPTVETRTVTETQAIPYSTTRVNDSSLPKGTTKVRTHGVNGVRTLTYTVTLTNGVQTSKTLLNQQVTKQPVTQVVAVGTKATQQCDPNYSGACVPIASDVDCAGGGGNGPAYVQGPVKVIGTDIYNLDSDGDGIGCES